MVREMIVKLLVIFVERIIDYIDFAEWNMVLFMDDTLGSFRNGNNLVGEHKAFVFNFMD